MAANETSFADDRATRSISIGRWPIQLIVQGDDPNQPREVRKAAIVVLGDYDDTGAVPTLQKLLSDGDAEIRQAARDALAQKAGPPAGAFPMLHR